MVSRRPRDSLEEDVIFKGVMPVDAMSNDAM